jgi:iron complex outermembrane receptor protein
MPGNCFARATNLLLIRIRAMNPRMRSTNHNQAMKPTKTLITSTLALACVPFAAIAQETADEDAVFELSPFEVNQLNDRGYIASTQVTGTRLNMPIKDLPFFLSVLTEDFLADTAVTSVHEALRFVPGVQPRPSANYQDTGFFMRGQSVDFVFRDGLRAFRPPSTDNIERVEVLKGPAAVLFGESSPGGGINFISKKARFTDFGMLTLETGSYGRMKSMVDINSTVRDDKLAFRFVGSWEDGDAFTDFEEKTRWMIAPSLLFKPFENSRIEVSFEKFSIERDGHLWNGHFAWRGADNVGGLAPDGSTNAIDEIHPGMDLSDNMFANSFYEDDNTALIITYEQGITDWLRNRFSYAYTDGDNMNAGPVVNDRPLATDPNILNLVVARVSGNRNTERVLRNELLATYEGAGGTHSLLIGYEDVKDVFHRREMVNNNKFRDDANPLYIAYNAATNTLYGAALPGAIDLRDEELRSTTRQRAERTGMYATLQSRMVDDRLVLLAGVRRHEYDRYNMLAAEGSQFDGSASDTTPQVGASFAVLPNVTVFASYSESYRPQLGNDALDNPFPPLTGEGYEGGVKVELLDGKLVGTVSYFDLTLTGLIRTDFSFVKPDGTTGGNFASGEEQSKGFDVDLVYSPIPNWQTVIGLTLLDTEILNNTQQPQLIGLRTVNAAEVYATLWSKYTFTDGGMDGLWIAGGASYTGGGRITRYSWAFTNDSYTLVDIAAGYRFEARSVPMELQLNVKNILDERYYVYDSMPGSPIEWQVSLRMEF